MGEISFFDANFLLEMWLNREKSGKCRQYLIKKVEEVGISVLTAHIFYYFAIKNKDEPEDVFEFLDAYRIFDISEYDYKEAIKILKGKDFEDALQLACAIRHKAFELVTLDISLLKRYKENKAIKITLIK